MRRLRRVAGVAIAVVVVLVVGATVLLGADVSPPASDSAAFIVGPPGESLTVAPDSPLRLLQAEVNDVPRRAGRGELLTFQVVLTNAGNAVVRFDPCPNYFMNLGESSESAEPVVSSLNCGEVEPLEPGDSAAFDMEMVVPDSFATGEFSIFWRLDPHITSASSESIVVE